jgi:hypothetical protein
VTSPRRKNADLNSMAPASMGEPVRDVRIERKTGNVWVESGRVGGLRRVANMTPEERRESARKALDARWAKVREAKEAATS